MEEQHAADMNASLQLAFMEPHFDAKFPNVSGRLERSGGSKGRSHGAGLSPGSKLDGENSPLRPMVMSGAKLRIEGLRAHSELNDG